MGEIGGESCSKNHMGSELHQFSPTSALGHILTYPWPSLQLGSARCSRIEAELYLHPFWIVFAFSMPVQSLTKKEATPYWLTLWIESGWVSGCMEE